MSSRSVCVDVILEFELFLLLLFQTRALMCDVDVDDHNDMAMQVTETNWWQVT